MNKIKIAIVGVGNCASSLIQGIHYYREKTPQDAIGLMHWEIGGYKPGDIEVVAAIDTDKRKVGLDVHKAIFSAPNCTAIFYSDLPKSAVTVRMGRIMDGFADHMKDYGHSRTFVLADQQEPEETELIDGLKESGAEILLNYLPVGSEEAPLTSVQGQFGTADGIDNHTGRVGGILNRQPKLQIHGHITEQLALHADETNLVVVLPGHIITGADMNVLVYQALRRYGLHGLGF